jgi:hypothetical protein
MVASRTAKVWRSSGTKEDVPDQVLAPEGLAADCLPTAQSEVQKISRLNPSTYARKKTPFRTFCFAIFRLLGGLSSGFRPSVSSH